MINLRGLPFRTSRGEGGSAKRGLTIYVLYRKKKKKNRRQGGRGVNFQTKIEVVFYGGPLKEEKGPFWGKNCYFSIKNTQEIVANSILE